MKLLNAVLCVLSLQAVCAKGTLRSEHTGGTADGQAILKEFCGCSVVALDARSLRVFNGTQRDMLPFLLNQKKVRRSVHRFACV